MVPAIRGAESSLHLISPDSVEAKRKNWSWVPSSRANPTRLKIDIGEIRNLKNKSGVCKLVHLNALSYLLPFPPVFFPNSNRVPAEPRGKLILHT